MISKELLSQVLGFSKDNCWNDGNLTVLEEDGMSKINVFELAHKCKEWALRNHNIEIISSPTNDGAYCQIDNIIPVFKQSNYNQMDVGVELDFDSIIFDGTEEYDCIFKACQWILEKNERGEQYEA